MGKPCLRTLLAILLLVSLQSRAFTETAQYKTSKWELLTESHWGLIATHTKTGAKTRISVFHFGEDTILISKRPCENAKKTSDAVKVVLSSKKRTFSVRACAGDKIFTSSVEEQLAVLSEQLHASNIPTEVLNMLQLLPL